MIDEKIWIGIYQVGASLFIAIIVLYISFSLLYRFVHRKYKLETTNISYALLAAAILFSTGYLVSGASTSVITTLKILRSTNTGFALWKQMLSYTTLFMFTGLVISLIISFLSYSLFTRLTKNINELEEIRSNNIAVGMITGAIIVCITLIVKESVVYLIESFVPYPEIPAVY